MNDRADLDALVSRAMATPGRQAMRPVIEKELLHYDILYALEKEGLLTNLTFQGGTLLRLCYGSQRFSEDLDFAGGQDFSGTNARNIKTCIEDYIGKRYNMDVRVKEPREALNQPGLLGIKVAKWQVGVVTAPARPDIRTQRINIEVANVPAYTRVANTLDIHYSFLPDGYVDLVLMTESLDEVMADKLVSLANTTKYTRHRDIWDLAWLSQHGAEPDATLVRKKLSDYSVADYAAKARAMVERLPGIVDGAPFHQEMLRFLPAEVLERTLDNPKFKSFLSGRVSRLVDEMGNAVEGKHDPGSEFEFRM